MKKVYVLWLSFFLIPSIFSQVVYKMPLHYKKGNGKIFQTANPVLNRGLKDYTFDNEKFAEHIIKRFSFQTNQSIYNRYLNGEISRDSAVKRLIYLHLDTSNLSERPLNNAIFLLFGRDTSGFFHVIVDKNNNLNFTDDSDVVVKSGDKIDFTGEYEFFYKHNVYKKVLNIKLIVFETGYTFEDSLENKWKLSILSNFHKEGFFPKSKNEKIIFQFMPDGITHNYKSNPRFIYFNVSDSAKYKLDNITSFAYAIKDTFNIGNFFYKFDSLDFFGDTAYLTKIDGYKNSNGWNVGSNLKEFKFTDQNKNLYTTKNKSYTLIEFWGTWCSPCKELLPEIKRDVVLLKQKGIAYYSFAFEYSTREEFNKFLVDNEINWPNVYVTRNNEYNILLKNLKVITYPLFILKDSNDKIIFRDAGIDGYERLQKFISKKIK